MPAAMMAMMEVCSVTLRRFSGVRKWSDVKAKKTNSRMNTATMPYSCKWRRNSCTPVFLGAVNDNSIPARGVGDS